ncbi:hypothetical protein RvY_01566 [Ramazzottius varieornatus]|uniref:Uncharacterized protein n=1 Tax=Ramazzottius varieornatus TaxID=947166 RepID=A0A1D1UK87_RAMVA|nr:hypothetical protein RvY_01566 [Ramazzottius varieornatus]
MKSANSNAREGGRSRTSLGKPVGRESILPELRAIRKSGPHYCAAKEPATSTTSAVFRVLRFSARSLFVQQIPSCFE